MISSNLQLVRKVWDSKTTSLDVAARAARDEMMAALIQLSKEQIARRRQKRDGEWMPKPIPGESAWSRSGDLRRSITGVKMKIGFADYKAVVGPTIKYARHVELGGGNWPAGVKYPYMEPTYEKFRTQIVPQVQVKFFRRFAR